MPAFIQPMIDASGNTAYPYTTSDAVYVDVSGNTLDGVLDRIPIGHIKIASGGTYEFAVVNSVVYFRRQRMPNVHNDIAASKLFMVSGANDSIEIATLGVWDNMTFVYLDGKFTITNSTTEELVLCYNLLRCP